MCRPGFWVSAGHFYSDETPFTINSTFTPLWISLCLYLCNEVSFSAIQCYTLFITKPTTIQCVLIDIQIVSSCGRPVKNMAHYNGHCRKPTAIIKHESKAASKRIFNVRVLRISIVSLRSYTLSVNYPRSY
jgi:hypothetical protein